ncbi:bifunctional proline dehydrogenase/L-glutamate gamma-semialdehyde dehydrogenase PutA [Methyloligella sp. GL2]|uniref:bifunctional proline dehydrogenase/L-glutamate gamma-semialdehyde dehydrogenase PutA n=2 Tax=unclassified Methyloligella TaxID=2625955 RepID=UPI00157CED6B|nr:bifunctional proline dehydrogenase/L-glutamate gamma-semialdehyde dehydrogenase PutA [Methyloligella sp. GL2]QKP78777.1 bifunctional proline dehydrogenase/L-glutamate gamma-semialdehyde dehydrogenase PutA [Methyloligella sp. GL2]
MTNLEIAQTHAARMPSRAGIAELLLADEDRLVSELIEKARFASSEQARIETVARGLVQAAREGRRAYGGVDSFLHEYGLLSEEGVLLLCLAEALLRIPDKATADRLIAGTISAGDWAKHMGRSPSLFVNASTFGLMLTGRVLDWGTRDGAEISARLQRLVSRSGEGVIREALRHAMRILGGQFVLGETIEQALKNGASDAAKGYRFSFDMLGEAARSEADAKRYFERYAHAAEAIGKSEGRPEPRDDASLQSRSGLSVKLSALHPRYVPSQEARLHSELLPRLKALALAMREAWLPLTIDAEEADRLELSLGLLQALFEDPDLAAWNGLGLAVQGYSKRALPVIEWLGAVAEVTGRRIPVRLVKGAYWDSEIKWAQVAGLASYPVFTRKVNTDVSYIAAARAMLALPDAIFPQFATHNAHTVAAMYTLGEGKAYEFQRLFGMGEALHEAVVGEGGLNVPCRIYAPVGGHDDLLAYLVRRLLENGANTSFVNRLADDEAPISEIIADPVERAASLAEKANPSIPLPKDLFGPQRENSLGLPLWEDSICAPLMAEMEQALERPFAAAPIVGGAVLEDGPAETVTAPHDRRVVLGTCISADRAAIDAALDKATAAAPGWDALGGARRAAILERAADLLEADRPALMALLVREAGKTLANAQGDLREAVDHLRYAAAEARETFETPQAMPGPTGESNLLSLHGRGVFACISPWNFPLAIFLAQIGGALGAGNAVVAKPAEQTPLIAFRAVQLLHKAGVPGDVLHLLPGTGARVGAALGCDLRVNGVAFTGGTETGLAINRALAAREGPVTPLIAEMGGLNAMIVDSSALPEQVVDDVVASAFDSAGQRCSALRVLFLQEEIADKTLAMLTGLASEMVIGDPLDFATDIGPVIDAEAKHMLEAHKAKMCREAKEWLDLPLPPACAHGSFVTPAIYEIPSLSMLEKEVFGPILHVVRYAADRLGDVCEAINATGYGLTLGLHSRVEQTADFVAARVRAGNFYVNRNQIGAVVGVQPFGGEGLSGTGPKAGGPNYLEAFATERVRTTNTTASGGNAALLAAGDESL